MNKATKLILSCFVMSFMFVAAAQAQTSIADARALDGQEVTIEGVMNTPDYGFSNGQFYVQDETGGINVFYSGVGGSQNPQAWTVGDTLEITGTIGAFNGQIQIAPTSVTIVGAGDSRPSPTIITPAALTVDTLLQGTIVKLEDVSLADGEVWPADAQTSSGVSVNVTSGDSSFVLRIDRDESFFDGAPAPTERFNLTGVMGRFNDDVQILPFDTTDVQNIVQVTFNVNTATMPDTLEPTGYVGVFGGMSGPNGAGSSYIGQTVDWNNSTDIVTTNQGGDYWSVTFDMAAGDTYNYKYWAGTAPDAPLKNGNEQGWESGNNRVFSLPVDASADTIQALQWYETRQAPFTSEQDSLTLFFRVNVGAFVQDGTFDPANDQVGIRGLPEVFGNPSDWSATNTFLEAEPDNGKENINFYSGAVRVANTSADTLTDSIPYKFVLETSTGTQWDNVDGNPDGNRFIDIPAQDSTVNWVYFQETKPAEGTIVNTTLNFQVNVGILEGLGYFNSGIDTVYVRGTFNAWGTNETSFNSRDNVYEALGIPFTAAVGSEELYKYFIRWDDRRDDAESEFYLPEIQAESQGWEEPGVTGGADRALTIEEVADQPTVSEFYNGVEPEALLTDQNVDGGAITVTFSVNMAPAKTFDTAFDPAVDSVYLYIDTPFFALSNGIVVAGDNGENFITQPVEDIEALRFTDPDGDDVYTLELPLQLPTLNHIGFRIAYGSALDPNGSLLVNGGGFEAGRRHYQYIQPMVDASGNVTWPSSFSFPTLDWKREDLPFELPPDYQTVSNEDEFVDEAEQFTLRQNYPNPFNPTTNIQFNLATASDVTLTVYNVLGQRVATLLTGAKMSSGSHTVGFDASGLSSGVYFYRLQAGNFVSQRSMTLIK